MKLLVKTRQSYIVKVKKFTIQWRLGKTERECRFSHLLGTEVRGDVAVDLRVREVTNHTPAAHIALQEACPQQGVRGQAVHVVTGLGEAA